jgi:hypothetical protein
MPSSAPAHPIRSAVKHGWIRFVGAARPEGGFGLPRRRKRKDKARLSPLALFKHNIDPVELAVLTLNLLGPAMMRANIYGKKVVVTAPDRQTGDIFRAALAQSQQNRVTDRLIDIVIAEGAADPDLATSGPH